MSQSFRDRVRPWECTACHQQHISANKTSCPGCQTPRSGTAAAVADEASGQTTRVYEGEKALQAGIALMAQQGWRVVSQTSFQPASGPGRAVALGLVGALVFKPAVKFTVIFSKV